MAGTEHDPYRPPASDLTPRVERRGSAVKAVVLGSLADIGGSFAAGIIITFAYGFALGVSGLNADQITAALTSIQADSWVSIIGMIVGGGFSVLGGYLCARIARHSEYRLGAIVAIISSAGGHLMGGQSNAGLELALVAATVASVMLGAWIGAVKNRPG